MSMDTSFIRPRKQTTAKQDTAGFNVEIGFSPLKQGYIAIALVVLIWAGFALTIRFISQSLLTTGDVLLIRFLVPVVVLLPFAWRRLGKLKSVSLVNYGLLMIGGIPFFLMASEGGKTTSAAYVGTLIAGTSPIFVALIVYMLGQGALTIRQRYSLALVIVGVGLVVLGHSSPGDFNSERRGDFGRGVAFLIGASFLWASYTIGLKRIGLDAITNALVLSLSSLILLVPLMATGVIDSNIGHFTIVDAIPFILVQGLGVGLIAAVCYSFAISRLGASESATFGSLAPVLTALLAVPFLGESLSLILLIGILLVTLGVARFSR